MSYQTDKRPAAVLYGEAIRLLQELSQFLENSKALPATLIPDRRERAPQSSPEGQQLPDWVTRTSVLDAVHVRLIRLGLNAATDGQQVQYSLNGDSEPPILTLCQPRDSLLLGEFRFQWDDLGKLPSTSLTCQRLDDRESHFLAAAVIDEHTNPDDVATLAQQLVSRQ